MEYGSARKSVLDQLEPIQNRSLRMATGAFPTTPITSPLCETNELPLSDQRTLLSLKYFLKLHANPNNPANYIIKSNSVPRFLNEPNHTKPLSARCQEYLSSNMK